MVGDALTTLILGIRMHSLYFKTLVFPCTATAAALALCRLRLLTCPCCSPPQPLASAASPSLASQPPLPSSRATPLMAARSGASLASAASDRKKQALERRFAIAKAELLQQQRREDKKRTFSQVGEADGGSSSAAPQDPVFSSNKGSGRVMFTYSAPHQETLGFSDSTAHSIYSKIPQSIHENLLCPTSEVLSRGGGVGSIVLDILRNGDSGDKYMKGCKKVPIDGTLLLDNFVARGDGATDARIRTLKGQSKRSKKHMSMRQHRKCGSLDLPKEFHKFDLFKPMHDMWKEYIVEVVAKSGNKQLAQSLLMADLHGAVLHVVECKTTSFNGVSGIMIRETAETFGLITQDNRFRVVPKRGSVFILQAGCWKVTLYGDKLSLRSTGA